MRQVTGLTSTYSSDVFGVCSALYELGGMIVMHDASGCNSTYTTHDEPRWYDMDSMIYISAISEKEAILGDDDKFIGDLLETAEKLHPKFIALVDAPIPYMIGTDLSAIARIVQNRTGIPGFAFYANGMHDYTLGVSKALEEIVRAYAGAQPGCLCDAGIEKTNGASDSVSAVGQVDAPVVNLLGVTPLDFSIGGNVETMQRWVADLGMQNGTCLAMGCTLEDIARLPDGQVNLVVSSGGLAAARWLKERFGMPYVVGVPYGEGFSAALAETVRQTVSQPNDSEECVIAYRRDLLEETSLGEASCVIIGEAVTSASLAAAIEMERGICVRVLCPLESGPELLRPGDAAAPEEDDLIREIAEADAVIADPLYRPLCEGKAFYPLPHTAFSGRIYEKEMPNLIARKLS